MKFVLWIGYEFASTPSRHISAVYTLIMYLKTLAAFRKGDRHVHAEA